MGREGTKTYQKGGRRRKDGKGGYRKHIRRVRGGERMGREGTKTYQKVGMGRSGRAWKGEM